MIKKSEYVSSMYSRNRVLQTSFVVTKPPKQHPHTAKYKQATIALRHLSYSTKPSSISPWVTAGERERTCALPGEILYLSTSSAASAANVGAPQASPMVVSPFSLSVHFLCLELV